jgi:ketosteroid isomerase-like protein
MSVDAYKELDEFVRSMRQAYNNRDLKLFRSHFWTDKRFVHIDGSGRTDQGWGSYEEVLDQEFRYMDTVKLDLKDLSFQVFSEQFASVVGLWSSTQVDPDGRELHQQGRASFTVARTGDDWKIVTQHFSLLPNGET